MITIDKAILDNEYAVEIKQLAYAYNNNSPLFNNINLDVKKGRCVGIIGKSGSGKSTLLKIINGSLRPLKGEIKVLGIDIRTGYINGLRKRVAYIPQNLGLVNNTSVLENVILPCARDDTIRALLGLWKSKYLTEAINILKSVGLEAKAKSKINRLSGGEMQRVAIARALMQRAELILADEPVSNLDDENANAILRIIKGLCKDGRSAIVIIHNKRFAEEYMDETYHLSNGIFERLW